MKIGLFTVMYNDKPLEEVAKYASGLGYEAFELAERLLAEVANLIGSGPPS